MQQKILKDQDNQEQENKIANYLDKSKNQACSEGIKQQETSISPSNSEQEAIRKVNPFFKKIDRHYGSFRTKILGNHQSIFNSLKFKEIKPLGKTGTGCRRKAFFHNEFTAMLYSNGTIEIRPVRKTGLNPDELQADFFSKAKLCCSLLEQKGLALGALELNRSPKYGYRDKTASFVKEEYKGKDRGMDSTPDPNSIDNFSCAAAKRDLRLSGDQNFEIAKARADNPEVIGSLESKMEFIIDSNSKFAENLALHLKVLSDLGKAVNRLGAGHRFPSSFNKSATVRGVN
jgi:hypothetical protein